MGVSLKRVDVSSRYVLENLYSYYLYEMSEFTNNSPDQNGLYTPKPKDLNSYWQHENHTPYFIYAEDQLAGFALIRRYPNGRGTYDVEQFFVLRKFKRQGVGKNALLKVLATHPGKWQIRVLKENEAALKFWLLAVSSAVGNSFEVALDIDVDLEMHFIRFESANNQHVGG